MALPKRTIRRAVAYISGDRHRGTTTSAGSTTTAISTQYDGYGNGYFDDWWYLCNDGTPALQFRRIDSFVGETSPATFTLARALTAAPGSGQTFDIYKYRPDYYTTAINRAIRVAYPYLHVKTLDSSTTLTADDYKYNMPAGITPQMVRRVMMEGDIPFASTPYHLLEDWSFNPDDSEIWLNRLNNARYYSVTTDKKLYIYAEKYLTALAEDSDELLVTDTTGGVELTETTDAWELFLMYCKAMLFDVLASDSANVDRQEHASIAREFFERADDHKWKLRMPPMGAGVYA